MSLQGDLGKNRLCVFYVTPDDNMCITQYTVWQPETRKGQSCEWSGRRSEESGWHEKAEERCDAGTQRTEVRYFSQKLFLTQINVLCSILGKLEYYSLIYICVKSASLL